MLARLFRSIEGEPRTPLPRTSLTMPQSSAQPSGSTSGPDRRSKPPYQNTGPKHRPKPVRIARLYPQLPSEPSRHARALIDLIQEECPDFVGLYVPKSD